MRTAPSVFDAPLVTAKFRSRLHLVGISILSSRVVGIVHPAASLRVNLARFRTPGRPKWSPHGRAALTPSLNTEIAFARSDFSDIAPSFTSLLDRFFCSYRFDYPAGTGSMGMLRSMAPNRRRFRCPSARESLHAQYARGHGSALVVASCPHRRSRLLSRAVLLQRR